MVKVVWTHSAIQALEDIGEYIANDSDKYAKIVVQQLFESTDILEAYPKAGRIVPEFRNKRIRELIRMNYRIVYLIVSLERIDVLTVHHSARLLKKSRLGKRKV
jgi:toxin ParE1/3/4